VAEKRSGLLEIFAAGGIAHLLGEADQPFGADPMSGVAKLPGQLREPRRTLSGHGLVHRFHQAGDLHLEVFEQIFEAFGVTAESVERTGAIEDFHGTLYQRGLGR